MDLLERASLLDELGAALGATATGGCVVLVAGEAGIGKSALVRRFAERHSADARFLLGACDPLLTPRALGPLHDLGRQTGGRLAALLAAGSPREQLFAALLDELDRGARPQVVVVEDAHWADEATLDLLVFLGRRMERTRALLIVTYRDDELAVDHPLRGVVGRLPPEAVRRLRLPPLSEAAVAELARRAGRPAAGLRSLTGGNPLLVTEVLAAADAGVPLTVRDLVLARFGGLPADAQEVVRLVAVVPTRAELWLLEAAARPAPSAVEAGVSAGLLVAGADGGRVPPRAAPAGGRGLAVGPGPPGAEPAGAGGAGRRHRTGRSTSPGWSTTPARPATPRPCCGTRRRRPGRRRRSRPTARPSGTTGRRWPHAGRLPAAARAELLEGYSVEAYLSGLARRGGLAARPGGACASGRRPATGSSSARACAGCRACTGGRAAGEEAEAAAARAIAVLETLAPGHQLAMAYSNQAQLDMLAYRTEAAMALGRRGRSSWPGGWATRRRSATP